MPVTHKNDVISYLVTNLKHTHQNASKMVEEHSHVVEEGIRQKWEAQQVVDEIVNVQTKKNRMEKEEPPPPEEPSPPSPSEEPSPPPEDSSSSPEQDFGESKYPPK